MRIAVFLLAMALPLVSFAADPPFASLRYQRDLIRISHNTWGLDAPVSVFAAQIHQESTWNPEAVSQVGAKGLAQFMPSTSNWISGLYVNLQDNQPENPAWAMEAMITYDIWLWNRIRASDQCSQMAMALSGYNGGLGWVYKDQAYAQSKGADRTRWFGQVEIFNAGRAPAAFKENRDYPRKILIKWQPLYSQWGGGIKCN